MARTITPATSLDNLRNEAKRWLKGLRANDPDARDRFERAYPAGPAHPVLRDAQHALAREYGHESWKALTQALATGAPPVPAYGIDAPENRIAPRRLLTGAEWDALVAVMKERRITALDAIGLMTDAVLARVAGRDHVTSLSLGGSRELSDNGLLLLARMPQLQHLDLSEYPGGKLTDRGLEVLRHLPNLRTFDMTWQRGITDAGVANLRFCDQLYAGLTLITDRSLEILGRMPSLEQVEFYETQGVTDAGLVFLAGLPRLREVHLDGLPGVTLEGTRVFPAHVRVKYST